MKILDCKIILPTAEQVEWADAELGVIIHFDLPTFHAGYNFRKHWGDCLPASDFAPSSLNTDQWLSAAKEMGAKYAVLVAKHCTGFCLWPTEAHDYSVKNSPWKDGKGDVVRDFFASCKKNGIRPGLYYSSSCNQYMNVDNPGTVRDGDPEAQKRYNTMVERQLTELWTWYGDIFEIWFDGGCLPVEQGGPDIARIMKKLQPDAVVFQGPEDTKSLVRWSGNERGEAYEDNSSICNWRGQGSDGTVEEKYAGNTFGTIWSPAESDIPNRYHSETVDGWFWAPGQEDAVIPAEDLMSRYLSSVGRNANMLIGMGIDNRGEFPEKDQAAFAAFGSMIRSIFAKPLMAERSHPEEDRYVLSLKSGEEAKYLVLGENIAMGERITGFTVKIYDENGVCCYQKDGKIIGHKRILEIPANSRAAELTILECKDDIQLRFFDFY